MARGGDSSNPTIRILVLGAHGVGKNCLESRFTTGQWPPSYDASLTLCSRRFYTFQHGGGGERGAGSSASRTSEAPDESRGSCRSSTSFPCPSREDTPLSPGPDAPAPPPPPASPTASGPQPCAACLARSRTHLIEIINYPLLHHAATRRKVLSAGEHDAVVLVYDVGSRASLDRVRALHAEATAGPSAHDTPGRATSAARRRRRRWGPLGTFRGAAQGEGGRDGAAPATVLAVVGNKCDVDDGGHGAPDFGGEGGGCGEAAGVNAPGSGTAEGTRRQRQVSSTEGAALASELETQVPFLEASAKTGKNVEAVFEAVARAVLKERGRGKADSGELAKRCRHRDRSGEGENGETRLGGGAASLGLAAPVFGRAATVSEVKDSSLVRPVEVRGLERGNMGTVLEMPVVSQSVDGQHPRWESVVERVRKIFIKESPVGGGSMS